MANETPNPVPPVETPTMPAEPETPIGDPPANPGEQPPVREPKPDPS